MLTGSQVPVLWGGYFTGVETETVSILPKIAQQGTAELRPGRALGVRPQSLCPRLPPRPFGEPQSACPLETGQLLLEPRAEVSVQEHEPGIARSPDFLKTFSPAAGNVEFWV